MDLKMYILVNQDIEISKGKVAGQVGHAVASYFYHCEDKALIRNYMENQQKKIILACPQTELDPDTLTCITLGIIDCDDVNEHGENPVPKYIKRLRLYK